MGNKSSKQKLIEINNYYNSLNNFECCICFTEYIDKIERVKCKHSICKRCAFISYLTNTSLPKTFGDHSDSFEFLTVWFLMFDFIVNLGNVMFDVVEHLRIFFEFCVFGKFVVFYSQEP